MQRSMFSGVSGLKGHQTRMDVIGNNIANVNTTGFKSSRVTFADMISQNLSGASAPNGNIGGTNPKQVGLGMNIASVDLLFTNASVQQTGKNTDVAIQGNGLFVTKRGNETFYTRNGAFSFDAKGNLVLPGSGQYVQGYMARNGVLSVAGDNTENINIPADKSMEAAVSTTAVYTNNLNASTPGHELKNILVRYANGTSETVSNYNPVGTGQYTLTMSTGKKIVLGASAPSQTAGSAPTGALYTSRITSVTAQTGGPVNLALHTNYPADASSPLRVNGGAAITRTGLTSGTYSHNGNYNISGTISAVATNVPTPGVTRLTLSADNNINPGTPVTVDVPNPTTFTYAVGNTYSGTLRIGNITAGVGSLMNTADGNQAKLTTAVTVTSGIQNYTHMGSASDGTIASISRRAAYQFNGKSVSGVTLNTKTGTALAGLVGKSYATNDTFYPPVTSQIEVYDSLGAKHTVPVVYTKVSNNKWQISLGTGGDSYSIQEADGTTTTVTLTKTDLTFDSSGAYTGGNGMLNLTYGNGAANQQVSLGLGALTQYSGTSTIAGKADGNAAGVLKNVEIDSSGVITGVYSNGVRQKEAQIAFARFNNPAGLTKMGGSFYQESNNTGTRTISGASDLGLDITTSALEMSNVDIADQFSDMIITQRGFQSNSKIITVSDEMLETLINMKR